MKIKYTFNNRTDSNNIKLSVQVDDNGTEVAGEGVYLLAENVVDLDSDFEDSLEARGIDAFSVQEAIEKRRTSI